MIDNGDATYSARTALLVLLSIVLVTSGCAGLFGPDRPPSDQRAVETVADSRAAIENVDSYRFTMDGNVEARQGDEQRAVDVTGSGTVNVTRQRMNATASTRDTTRETYLTGYTVYSECDRVAGTWGRSDLSREDRWFNYTPAGEQLALLARTDVYWRGTERVDGTEAAVVEAYPTGEELQSTATVQGTDPANIERADIENVTVTVWIGTDENRPLKARREIHIEQNGVTATATVTFRFTAYDEPARVSRPAIDDDAVWETGCPGE